MFSAESLIVLDPYPGPEVTWQQVFDYVKSRDDLGPLPAPYDSVESLESWCRTAVMVAEEWWIPVAGFVGQIFHETNVLRYGNDVLPDQYNYGGIGATGNGVRGHSFPTFFSGLTVNAEHLWAYAIGHRFLWASKREVPHNLYDPRYHAVVDNIQGRGSWAGVAPRWIDLAGKWAEHVGTYRVGIERHANGVLGTRQEEEGPSVLKVAIAAGHHNDQGGNQTEVQVVSEIAERMYYHFDRTPGIEVRSLIPDGPDEDDLPGDGHVNLRIFAMWSQTLAQWGREGWVPDLCIEEHTQGVGNTSVRGWFGIHPSMGGDVDVDVRDVLLPEIIEKVETHSAWSIWTDGIMPEHHTGVGIDGHRLGFFSATAYLAATAERVLFENGAHSNPGDLLLLRDHAKVDQLCQAKVAAICAYYDIPFQYQQQVTDPAPPVEDAITFKGTGKQIDLPAFMLRWRELGMNAWKHAGMPITNTLEVHIPVPQEGSLDSRFNIRQVQIFEKDVWMYHPDNSDGWDVQSVNQFERDYILAYARLAGIHIFGEGSDE